MSKTLKERYLAGEKNTRSRISMASTREQVHETIADTGCDIIYIDCQHGPYTEWDISRISKAAEEKSVPVLLRVKHTRHAYRLGNYCVQSRFLRSRQKILSTKQLIHSTSYWLLIHIVFSLPCPHAFQPHSLLAYCLAHTCTLEIMNFCL